MCDVGKVAFVLAIIFAYLNAPSSAEVARKPPELPRLAMFPLFFDHNARRSDGWRQGIELLPTQIELLRQLMEALQECAGTGDDGHVRLHVVGFASSREFLINGKPTSRSADDNLKTANLRAKSVARYLQTVQSEMGIAEGMEIKDVPWESYENMVHARPYNDRPRSPNHKGEAEILNRVVEIHLLQAGRCEFLPRTLGNRPERK